MAIGTVVGFSGSPGGSQTATASATLPTITVDGYALAVVGTNAGSTTSITTPPAGWALVDGPYNNASNNMRVWLYGKAVTSADSGASFSAVFSATGRWGVAGAYVPGASGVDVLGQWIDNTDDTSIDVPAITPTVDDTYRLVLLYDRSVSGALTVTPPAGWDELGDVCSTNASGARFGAWGGGVQLTGQAGVAQGTATATYSTSARNSGWQVTLAPVATSESHSGSASLSGTGVLSAVATAALAATVALSGSGALAATGTPAATRAVSLSGSGSLLATGAPGIPRAVALSGSGTLTAAGTPTPSVSVALSGSGTLAATTTPQPATTATLTGTGTLTATGSSSEAATGTAALSGAGTLAASGTPRPAMAVALSGTGTLTATGTASQTGSVTVSLTGGGTLSTTAIPHAQSAASLSGSGDLTAPGNPAAVATASLGGEGALTATGAAAAAVTRGSMTGGMGAAATIRDATPATPTVTPTAGDAPGMTGVTGGGASMGT